MCVSQLLHDAEELERQASVQRVAFFAPHLPGTNVRLLDVGCGNGYAVERWRAAGARAFGVDISRYRLGRWAAEHRGRRLLVLADAGALPFAARAFDLVVSSGMIEHVGVSEQSSPYRVRANADRDQARAVVVGEIGRVTAAAGTSLIDFPNGAFPIDFWHGDVVGAFRWHPVPDQLLPDFDDLATWGAAAGRRARLLAVTGRLAFRQVGRHWWGRALALPMQGLLRLLDALVRHGWTWLPARLYPYLVVAIGPEGR